MEENKFILCATDSDIQSALTAKRTSPYLVLDCEGQNLGTEGGTLALLSIGTASGRDVFLFEAVALARATPPMDELMALLGASDVTKIMWDCRMDAVALRQCGVSLAGVLDMQLAEVVSRAAALGEDEYRRLRRLRFVDEEAPGKAATRYVGVHAVTGMDKCLSLCKGGLEHVKSGA
jgi:exonuclease 3'-5' domain-containing protein 1